MNDHDFPIQDFVQASQSLEPTYCQWLVCRYYYFMGVHINLQLIVSL